MVKIGAKEAEQNSVPEVSVIIPVYNAEKYLEQCIDSVLSQTLHNIEIICVDDGSTDDSLKMLNAYQKKDKRLLVISQKNQNAGAARNTGLKQAKGKYLIFLDADDFFEPEMLENMHKKATEDKADIVVCGYWVYNQKQKKDVAKKIPSAHLAQNSPLCPEQYEYSIFKQCYSTPWSKLISHRLFSTYNLQFENLKKCNDLTCMYAAVAVAEKISFISTPFVHYRWNSGTQLSTARFGQNEDFIYAVAALEDKLKKLEIYDKFYERMFFAVYDCLCWETKGKIKILRDLAEKRLSSKLFNDLFYSDKYKEIKQKSMVKRTYKVKLLFFIPLYTKDVRGGKTVWKICGLPLLKRRKMENGVTTKYYILGVPFLKIS
ncbi:MAG: glycosyltransferase family 2 protein [Alphaproteobacteria bacterium]|nr:glycosyltransferase family 2 protein [Alphaproteobacteria bacterium]